MGSRAALGLFCFGFATACTDDGSTDDEVGETSTATDSDSGETSTATETGSSSADTTGSDTTQGDTTSGPDTTGPDTETDTTSSDTATTTDTTDTTTGDPDVCGDMMITGDEICDDGVNDGSYGGCNPDCLGLAAHCGDMMINGPEECDDALNGDSADGCLDSCAVPGSCLELHEYDAMLTDGVYLIDPEGFAGDPFPATCDMTTDGGGWTLAMRFAPAMAQFHFYSTHWTTNTVVNEMVTDPVDPSDGKFMAYNELPGDAIRGCLRNPQDMSWGCKLYDLPMTTTLLDLFTTVQVGSDVTMKGLYFMETQAEKIEWLTNQGRTLAQSSVPNPNYVQVGINLDDDQSCYDARVRFGLVLNNENSIVTLNDAAGFGAQAYYTAACDLAPGVDSGWKTASGFAAGSTIYDTAGQIWVR